MGYQALLFCPDEKTARTVTQVLSELEFGVEPCTETFAAVKRLMGEHFDAVVVDCDNEQNATLLFKSARNSTSNQASLAVAVVEGQAGVAKAFRIGANLVLTKPINVDQAKGTLRVARGLLRKGDGGKPAAPAPAPPTPAGQRSAAPPAKPVSAPPAAARPSVPPMAPPSLNRVAATAPQAAKLPPAAASTSVTHVPAAPVPAAPVPAAPASAAPPAAIISAEALPAPRPVSPLSVPSASAVPSASGAASAPAPAREALPVSPAETPLRSISAAEEILANAATAAPAAATDSAISAPLFTFGGMNAPETSKGGSKRALIGVAAVALIGALAYVGWTYIQGHHTSSMSTLATDPQPSSTQPTPATPKPSPYAAAPATSIGSQPSAKTAPAESVAATPSAASRAETEPASGHTSGQPSGEEASSITTSSKANAAASKSAATSEPEESPLIVKGGTVPKANVQPATPDVPAPSVIGMDAPASGGQLPNLGSVDTPKPVLQKLNVSQGVSQGLLLKRVDPVYPPSAVHMQIEGAVQLLATISKSGAITDVKVLSGDKQLARAAVDAVKRWKYAPYLLNGDPVDIQTQITINFKLPN